MEKWIAENWYYVGSLLVIAVWVYFEVKDMKKDLEAHLDPKNESPHPACPVHDVKFNQVVNDIKDIKRSIDTLDKRLFAFLKVNGHSIQMENDE